MGAAIIRDELGDIPAGGPSQRTPDFRITRVEVVDVPVIVPVNGFPQLEITLRFEIARMAPIADFGKDFFVGPRPGLVEDEVARKADQVLAFPGADIFRAIGGQGKRFVGILDEKESSVDFSEQRDPERADVDGGMSRRRPAGMAVQKSGEGAESGKILVAVDLHVPTACAHVLGEHVPLPGVVADGVQFRPMEVVAINLDFLVDVQLLEPVPEGIFNRERVSGPGAAVLVDRQGDAVRMVVEQGQGVAGIPIVVGDQHADFDGRRVHGVNAASLGFAG